MPSEETLLLQAEKFKKEGNESFQKGSVAEAVSAYSQGIVACDRITPPPPGLKAALLSNRAMCYLKAMQLSKCIEDCSLGLDLKLSDAKLRSKLLYRRSKARFMLANLDGPSSDKTYNLLQDAAKDLLTLLQSDPKNSDANKLLLTVRSQVKSLETASTPVSKTLEALKEAAQNGDVDTLLQKIKLLLGIIGNDTAGASMELGRLEGLPFLFKLVDDHSSADKLPVLVIQCLSQAGSHPAFARTYLVNHQKDLAEIVKINVNSEAEQERSSSVVVAALAAYLRIILHADRDDPDKDIMGSTLLEYPTLVETCKVALSSEDKLAIRAVLDLVTTWTCGKDRMATIRAALSGQPDPTLPTPKTQSEIRSFTPQQLAEYRKRERDSATRDEAWAFERSMDFHREGALKVLLKVACACHDHLLRREMTVVVGRLMVALDDEDNTKKVVQTYLGEPKDKHDGVVIEEIFNEDEEEKFLEEEEAVPLEIKMERALISSALLLSRKEIGVWALGTGWKDCSDELPDLIKSGDSRAMCLASEVVSGAATIESARHIVTNLVDSGVMQTLIMSDDRDIRSGAASAVAKLGLSDKGADEGEIIGLLQAACQLLEDGDDAVEKQVSDKFRNINSFATSSVERAIEMITYLISKTDVKEELAAGFQGSPDSRYTALESLVNISCRPNAGESLSGFGLATIFQHMAVTNERLRKEGFEGKEVTMEQYDEMQKLGKTEEEKEVMEAQKDTDTEAACGERIRKMASANVPRSLVSLIEGASEHTLEQVVQAMNRMAGEASVRGLMIQQGVLTACIKVEKKEGPTDTDTMKNVIKFARHCIAKMLITTNPSLLTSAQRLGSIKPLIGLIRDHKASDLQHFEALLAITNIASSGDDAKNRIVSERGIPCFHFAMFDSHEMVQRSATEAMCNMVPHKAMMDHLANGENLGLWFAFASDVEKNYECARAASGCLAMATQDKAIALKVTSLEKFSDSMNSLLQSGRLEIMHRALVIVLNLMMHGGECRDKTVSEGIVLFCEAYVDSFHNNKELEFPEEEAGLMPVTIELAEKIVSIASSS